MVNAELEGRHFWTLGRKVAPATTHQPGGWQDLNCAFGTPVAANYVGAPLTACQMKYSVQHSGLSHGPDVSPLFYEKYLKSWGMFSPSTTFAPAWVVMCDYLLYYPGVDLTSLSEQVMVNNVALPRYADGDGVQIMAVMETVTDVATNTPFRVEYTASDGSTGNWTQVVTTFPTAGFGSIATSSFQTLPVAPLTGAQCVGPFLPLAPGHSGVRAITKVQMLGQDPGSVTLVLVKPLASAVVRDPAIPCEQTYFVDFPILPVIKDDAHLGMIYSATSQLVVTTTQLISYIETIWG